MSTATDSSRIVVQDPKALQSLICDWVRDYSDKSESISDADWLEHKFALHISDVPEEERQLTAQTLAEQTASISSARLNLSKAQSRGMDRDEWLYRELRNTINGRQLQNFGDYTYNIDETMKRCNEEWQKVFITKNGTINQNPHLHGYIFETHHTNSFDELAALKGKKIRAEVLRPEPGKPYSKNSPDIRGADGKLIQAKAGKNQTSTEAMVKKGDYTNQEILVPKGQDRPGFSSDHIEAGGIKSKSASYDGLKEIQRQAQEEGKLPENSWSDFETKELVFGIGKQVAAATLFASAGGALLSAGNQWRESGEIDGWEVAKASLQSGARAGFTTAISGALKVAVEKKILSIPSSVPVVAGLKGLRVTVAQASIISAIASTAVEFAVTALKVAKGELRVGEALEELECNAASTLVGLETATTGAAYCATAGGVFGPVGAAVGGFVGGTIGYMAGSTIGKMVAQGAQKLREKAMSTLNSAWNQAKNVAVPVFSNVKSVLSMIFE